MIRVLMQRHRDSLLALANLGCSRLIVTGISFLSSILIARELGVNQLGIFSLVTGAFAYVSIAAEFGLRSAITAESSLRDNIGGVFGAYLRLRLLISCAVYVAVMAGAWVLYPEHLIVTAIIMFSVIAFALQIDWVLLVKQRYHAAAWAGAMRWIAYFAMIVVFSFLGGLRLVPLSYMFLGSWIVTAVLSWAIVIKSGIALSPNPEDDLPTSKQLLRIGAPVLGATLVSQALQNTDLLWIGSTLGASKAGYYYLSNAIIGAGVIFANAMGQVALARYAPLRDHPHQFHARLATDLHLLTLISGIASLALLVIAPWLVPIFFGTSYAESAKLIQYLLPYLIFYHVWSFYYSVCIALGLERSLFLAKLMTLALLPIVLCIASFIGDLRAFALGKSLVLFWGIFLMHKLTPQIMRGDFLRLFSRPLALAVIFAVVVNFFG